MKPRDDDSIETSYRLERHVEGESRHLDASLHLLDLNQELAELRGTETWQNVGQTAKTLLKLPDLRVVLIALSAGARLQPHKADGAISIQVVSGRTRLHVEGRRLELTAGQILAIDQSIQHDLEAVEDSGVLLTIAWSGLLS